MDTDKLNVEPLYNLKITMQLCRNLDPGPPSKFDLDTKGSRRLATDFAFRVISKVAEDNSGDIIEGSQMWDMDNMSKQTIEIYYIVKANKN